MRLSRWRPVGRNHHARRPPMPTSYVQVLMVSGGGCAASGIWSGLTMALAGTSVLY